MIHATKELHSRFLFMQKSNKNKQVLLSLYSLTEMFSIQINIFYLMFQGPI